MWRGFEWTRIDGGIFEVDGEGVKVISKRSMLIVIMRDSVRWMRTSE